MDFWSLEISANHVRRKKCVNYTHALISIFTVNNHFYECVCISSYVSEAKGKVSLSCSKGIYFLE